MVSLPRTSKRLKRDSSKIKTVNDMLKFTAQKEYAIKRNSTWDHKRPTTYSELLSIHRDAVALFGA